MKKVLIGILLLIILVAIIWWFFIPIKIVGYKNGHLIIMSQFCSDYCPGYGDTLESWKRYGHREYLHVTTEESCLEIKGKPVIDGAYRIYRYCSPE